MTTDWTFVDAFYAGVPGLDPYVEWALEPGRPYYFLPGRQTHWIPVLLQLADVTPSEFQEGDTFIADKVKWKAMVRVSELFLYGGEPKGGQCPALVTEPFFKELRENSKLRARVPRLELSLPLDRESLPPFGNP